MRNIKSEPSNSFWLKFECPANAYHALMAAYQDGRLKEQIPNLVELVHDDSNTMASLMRLAIELIKEQDIPSALGCADIILSKDEGNLVGWMVRHIAHRKLFMQTESIEKAEEHLDEANEAAFVVHSMLSNHKEYWAPYLGSILLELKQILVPVELAGETHSQDHSEAVAWFDRGLALHQHGHELASAESLKRAIEFGHSEARNTLAGQQARVSETSI